MSYLHKWQKYWLLKSSTRFEQLKLTFQSIKVRWKCCLFLLCVTLRSEGGLVGGERQGEREVRDADGERERKEREEETRESTAHREFESKSFGFGAALPESGSGLKSYPREPSLLPNHRTILTEYT